MALRIATNVQALSAQRYLSKNHDAQNNALEHLASGSRINRAGDDAAGLAISEKLRANIRGLKQAGRNAADGISLIQTAEGAMNEVSNILIRLRELSIQAASDTVGDTERQFVDKEIQQLKSEIDRISNATEYNGTKLLNGRGGLKEGEEVDLSDASDPNRSKLILDIQVGLNNNPSQDRFQFDAGSIRTTVDALGINEVGTTNKAQAQQNMDYIDRAIYRVNENRANLGALQNRLGSTIQNLAIYRENLEGANSRIRDTDMAEESSELVKQNILTQANTSVLGQANSNPQLALKLLN